MARHPLPSFVILWNRHRELYRGVFSDALLLLAQKDTVPGDEDAISEVLCVLLQKVCWERNQAGQGKKVIPLPVWESPIQPVNEAELRGGKKRKRPDFTCGCIDPLADSQEKYQISLHVECKRLGRAASASWELNKNYVDHGIKRFDCPDHGYGKRAPSGMMIGYITGMTPEEIETAVNTYQKKQLPDFPGLRFIFDDKNLYKTCQEIERKNVLPHRFELDHLWVDLWDTYPG